jgi:hypothetical protein
MYDDFVRATTGECYLLPLTEILPSFCVSPRPFSTVGGRARQDDSSYINIQTELIFKIQNCQNKQSSSCLRFEIPILICPNLAKKFSQKLPIFLNRKNRLENLLDKKNFLHTLL